MLHFGIDNRGNVCRFTASAKTFSPKLPHWFSGPPRLLFSRVRGHFLPRSNSRDKADHWFAYRIPKNEWGDVSTLPYAITAPIGGKTLPFVWVRGYCLIETLQSCIRAYHLSAADPPTPTPPLPAITSPRHLFILLIQSQ